MAKRKRYDTEPKLGAARLVVEHRHTQAEAARRPGRYAQRSLALGECSDRNSRGEECGPMKGGAHLSESDPGPASLRHNRGHALLHRAGLPLCLFHCVVVHPPVVFVRAQNTFRLGVSQPILWHGLTAVASAPVCDYARRCDHMSLLWKRRQDRLSAPPAAGKATLAVRIHRNSSNQ